ncbi:hypothetical protein GCM10025862_22820 [Arsenicicoccus piscis]|uniref:Uncharacterized protein n=1 Tax=Arsenicicoccus piscis TaxID=673954 RepID=A0ABQ6HP72_9MICO|nr:hypothetical protein GCM10025862_22820 [Arsenicicoccus piscis]
MQQVTGVDQRDWPGLPLRAELGAAADPRDPTAHDDDRELAGAHTDLGSVVPGQLSTTQPSASARTTAGTALGRKFLRA